jgi:hypothetical protein
MNSMDGSEVTHAIMEIQQDLATIKNDLQWIKKNSTAENGAIKEICHRIEEVESWQDKATGALTIAKILGGLGTGGLFITLIKWFLFGG